MQLRADTAWKCAGSPDSPPSSAATHLGLFAARQPRPEPAATAAAAAVCCRCCCQVWAWQGLGQAWHALHWHALGGSSWHARLLEGHAGWWGRKGFAEGNPQAFNHSLARGTHTKGGRKQGECVAERGRAELTSADAEVYDDTNMHCGGSWCPKKDLLHTRFSWTPDEWKKSSSSSSGWMDEGGGSACRHQPLTSSTPPTMADLKAGRKPARSCRKPPVAAPAMIALKGSSCNATERSERLVKSVVCAGAASCGCAAHATALTVGLVTVPQDNSEPHPHDCSPSA